MKYIILHCDGVADEPVEELGWKTPLEVAKTPNIDFLAERGELGSYEPIPPSLHPGSDVGTLSLFGYDPVRYYTGRAPLEAASLGIEMDPEDVAFRCNLITVKPEGNRFILDDYSGGHLSKEEGRELMRTVQEELGNSVMKFYPGVAYRNILIWKNGPMDVKIPPPHDIMGEDVRRFIEMHQKVYEIFMASFRLLSEHSVNKKRMEIGKKPANAIWLWGQGKPPSLPSMKKLYNLNSAVISAVDLVKGIGKFAGMKVIDVPGATGYMDTNFKGKVEACVKYLEEGDLVVLHVEGIDEVSHSGNALEKVKAIETYDSEVVGKLLEKLEGFRKWKLLLTSDHLTPVRIRTHSRGAVPYLIFPSHSSERRTARWTERHCKEGPFISPGHFLLSRFLAG